MLYRFVSVRTLLTLLSLIKWCTRSVPHPCRVLPLLCRGHRCGVPAVCLPLAECCLSSAVGTDVVFPFTLRFYPNGSTDAILSDFSIPLQRTISSRNRYPVLLCCIYQHQCFICTVLSTQYCDPSDFW